MGNTTCVYECRCGQLTAVNLGCEQPKCSRCQEQTFTHLLKYEPNARQKKSNWIKSCLRMERNDEGIFEPYLESSEMPIDKLIDKNSSLRLSRARAILDHLDMLRQSQEIGDDMFEEETRRVLKRVVHMVRNGTPAKNK